MLGILHTRVTQAIAEYLPKKLRLELFMLVYRRCGSSPAATARVLKMHPRQVYFYIPGRRGKIRNFPSDETAAVILDAALKLSRGQALRVVRRALKRFSRLVFKLR